MIITNYIYYSDKLITDYIMQYDFELLFNNISTYITA